jgi:fatty-acyl-CoA synthase
MVPIDYFDHAVARHAARTAIVDGDVTVSYAELARQTHQVAVHLSRCCSPGAAVGLYSPNDHRVLMATLGIMRAGRPIMPLHARNIVDTTVRLLQQGQPECVIYHSSLARAVRQLREQAPGVRQWICLDASTDTDVSLELIVQGEERYVPDWIDVCGNRSTPVYYWATSGSTGEPKLVVDDCTTFLAMLLNVRTRRTWGEWPVSLAVAPLTHTAGPRSFSLLTEGATIVVMRDFDAREVLRAIQHYRVSDTWLPPTALQLILSVPNAVSYDLRSLINVELGAAAIAPDRLREAVALLGPCISQAYGQIESGVVSVLTKEMVAACLAGDHPARLASSGRTVCANTFAIMSEDGGLLPPLEHGEIVVRGTTVRRYLDEEATTIARRHGWHHTGDIGYVDHDGYLYFVGRLKEVVNVAGFKIPCAEVEQVVMELDHVQECAVIPVPDDLRGEAIKAIVVVRPGRTLTNDAILRHCRKRLGPGRAPSSVEQRSQLPRSPAGKIDRLQLRQDVHMAPAP